MGQQAPGHLLEQFIAHFMALAVVEGLEVIQIQKQQCTDLPRALGLHDGPAQAVEQQAAVGQAGEGIVEGQVLYLLLGAAQVGHVVVGDHQTTVGGVPLLQLDAAPIGQQLLRGAHAFTLLRLPFLNPLFAFGLRGGRQQISGRLLQQDAKRQLRGDIGGQPGYMTTNRRFQCTTRRWLSSKTNPPTMDSSASSSMALDAAVFCRAALNCRNTRPATTAASNKTVANSATASSTALRSACQRARASAMGRLTEKRSSGYSSERPSTSAGAPLMRAGTFQARSGNGVCAIKS